MSTTDLATIEIFKPGTHTDMGGHSITFDDATLAAIAANYDATRHEAPLVVGHPATDDPAYGWVTGLRMENGRLLADLQQVDGGLADLVQQGRYKKVSPSFYLPDSRANPKPGQFYLRHVGVLGAQPPAVKGLRTLKFADALTGDFITFTEVSMSQEELAAREEALRNRESELATQEAVFAERRTALERGLAEARQTRIQQQVDGLVASGHLLPREQHGVVALLTAMPEGQTLAFAEDDQQVQRTPEEVLLAILRRAAPAVTYGEMVDKVNLPPAFVAPPGWAVDADRSALHSQALSFMESNKGVDYLSAVQAVSRQGGGS